MLVIPAIDLRDGKCVRLKQGDYAQETIYSDFPWKMALDWANQRDPVLMCTPEMREASVIEEPAAMAAKNRCLSSGATFRLVPIRGLPYFFLGIFTPARFNIEAICF